MLDVLNVSTGVLANVSFSISAGELLIITGRSGVGKSTLARTLLGLDKSPITGQLILDGQTLPIADPNDPRWQAVRGTRMAYLPQDPKDSLNPLHSVAHAFALIHKRKKTPKATRHAQMVQALDDVQLPTSTLDRYPHELSGGQAQRVALALLLTLSADVLILDEPTSHLDDATAAAIWGLLRRHATAGKAIIAISHDRMAGDHADRVVQLGSTQHTAPTLTTAAHFNTPLLMCHDVGLAYKKTLFGKNHPILQGIHLTLHQGQIIAITGASGTGKSTLAKAITRLDDRLIITGQMRFRGDDITTLQGRALHRYRPQVMLMNQDVLASLNPYRTIHASLSEAISQSIRYGQDASVLWHEYSTLITELQLPDDVLARYPDALSGGERARVSLMRCLLMHPAIVILDEPSAMLDDATTTLLLTAVHEHRLRHGTAALIISHDLGHPMMQVLCNDVLHIG